MNVEQFRVFVGMGEDVWIHMDRTPVFVKQVFMEKIVKFLIRVDPYLVLTVAVVW
jgi:hypothetical protein